MKEIVIRISVPDGVEVRVNTTGNGQAQPQGRTFVQRPDPAYPGGNCPEHGTEWRLVPAGLSKTKVDNDGNPKPYNAFWACSEYGCNQKPGKPSVVEDLTYAQDDLPF